MSVEGRTLGKYALSRRDVVRLTDSPKATETNFKGIAAQSASTPKMVLSLV